MNEGGTSLFILNICHGVFGGCPVNFMNLLTGGYTTKVELHLFKCLVGAIIFSFGLAVLQVLL